MKHAVHSLPLQMAFWNRFLFNHMTFVGRIAVGMIIFAYSHSPVSGQSDPAWGQKMLELKEADFGVVANGVPALVQLKVKNIYKEDIHIRSVGNPSFGSSSWDRTGRDVVIRSGEEYLLELRADAIRFRGERKGTFRVRFFDRAHEVETEVEVPARIHIRPDIVVIDPSNTQFPVIEERKGAVRTFRLRHPSKVNLEKATSTNPKLEVSLRRLANADVNSESEITVTVKPDFPVGRFDERIEFVTDESQDFRFGVWVDGEVRPTIIVRSLSLKAIPIGKPTNGRIVVRALQPVQITEISRTKSDDARFQDESFEFKIDATVKNSHLIPVSFTCAGPEGEFDETFLLKIKDQDEPFPFHIKGTIVEATSKSSDPLKPQ